jgi:hypothetical protein
MNNKKNTTKVHVNSRTNEDEKKREAPSLKSKNVRDISDDQIAGTFNFEKGRNSILPDENMPEK